MLKVTKVLKTSENLVTESMMFPNFINFIQCI